VYVCVCNALKESQFEEIALKHPEATPHDAFEMLGAHPDCGSCAFYAIDVMKKARKRGVVPPNASIA
jgi:bacterioferritin-associated ferredoxin